MKERDHFEDIGIYWRSRRIAWLGHVIDADGWKEYT